MGMSVLNSLHTHSHWTEKREFSMPFQIANNIRTNRNSRTASTATIENDNGKQKANKKNLTLSRNHNYNEQYAMNKSSGNKLLLIFPVVCLWMTCMKTHSHHNFVFIFMLTKAQCSATMWCDKFVAAFIAYVISIFFKIIALSLGLSNWLN